MLDALAPLVAKLGGPSALASGLRRDFDALAHETGQAALEAIKIKLKTEKDPRVRVSRICELGVLDVINDALARKVPPPVGGGVDGALAFVTTVKMLASPNEFAAFARLCADWFVLSAAHAIPLMDVYDNVSGGVAIALAYAITGRTPIVEQFRVSSVTITYLDFVATWGSELFAGLPTPRMRSSGQHEFASHLDFLNTRPRLPFLVAPRDTSSPPDAKGRRRTLFNDRGLTSPAMGSVSYAAAQLRLYVVASIHQTAVDAVGMDFSVPLPRLRINATSRWGLGKKEPSITHHSGRVFDLWAEALPSESKNGEDLPLESWRSITATKTPKAKLDVPFAAVDHEIPPSKSSDPKGIELEEFKKRVTDQAWMTYFEGLEHRLKGGDSPFDNLKRALVLLGGTPDHASLPKRAWMHRSLIAILLAMPELVIFAGHMALLSAVASIERAGLTQQCPVLADWYRHMAEQKRLLSFDKPGIHNHHQHVVFPRRDVTDAELEFWSDLGISFDSFLTAVEESQALGVVQRGSSPAQLKELNALARRAAASRSPGRYEPVLIQLLAPTDLQDPTSSDDSDFSGYLSVRDNYQSLSQAITSIAIPLAGAVVQGVAPSRATAPELMASDDGGPATAATKPTADAVLAGWLSELAKSDASRLRPADDASRSFAAEQASAFATSAAFPLLSRFCIASAIATDVKGIARVGFDETARELAGSSDLPFTWTLTDKGKARPRVIGWRWAAPGDAAPASRRRAVPSCYRHATRINTSSLQDGASRDAIVFRVLRNAVVEIQTEPDWGSIVLRALSYSSESPLMIRLADVTLRIEGLAEPSADDPRLALRHALAKSLPTLLFVCCQYLTSIGRPDVFPFLASRLGPRVSF